ncbi:hypothetical protein FHX81_0424 [Saccharothrix saharensis]|uniref:DUF1524 domain-containing protein n=1 Tax=Saccharothrix saharensis TaxID=571190 RepID=A0A543J5V8_9PSEU|nr:DUF1524 domain-containing protein [Saccharothrix saharensis]TQM78168.1 hypothetical protein FHX81_0424 [Saccharothrix saharensis]
MRGRCVGLAVVCAVTLGVAVPGAARAAAAPEEILLREAVARLSVAEENREGYHHDAFKHWVDTDRDGCSTRAEVLLEEVVEPPQVTGRCTLTGGRWYSFYDDTHVDDAHGLDIDYMVALAEAWDSGARDWTAQRREDYANDLAELDALWAVTARSNRGKADQDPRQWMPPHQPAACCYLTAWVTVKTRRQLTVDPAERATLTALTRDCPDVPITTRPA